MPDKNFREWRIDNGGSNHATPLLYTNTIVHLKLFPGLVWNVLRPENTGFVSDNMASLLAMIIDEYSPQYIYKKIRSYLQSFWHSFIQTSYY